MTLPPPYEIDCHAVASELREAMTKTEADELPDDLGRYIRRATEMSEDGVYAWWSRLAALLTELQSRRAANSAGGVEVKLYGPYGWLNGHRGLSEDSWHLESDPLENNEEYFAIPLYAKVDPFVAAVTDADSLAPAAEAEPVAWQWSDFSGKWYTVDTARMSLAEQEELARAVAKERGGRVRPCFASSPVSAEVTEPEPLTLNRMHIDLLKRGSRGQFIWFHDRAELHTSEMYAVGQLCRAGLARRAAPRPIPGPPEMPGFEITEEGLALLAALNGGRENG